ncbi:glutathione peroxidase [Mycoplasmatota bacterium WC44]
MSKLYEYVVKNSRNEDVSLSAFEGKVMLIVNTASKCGFTSQYDELQALYEKWNQEGLEVLAFPCNQFAGQESGSNDEIQSFCQMNFGLTFPVYAKIDVNGQSAHPLYKFLRNEKRGILGNKIKWNFTKFLVDKNGNIVKRYAPTVKPLSIEKDIISLLK